MGILPDIIRPAKQATDFSQSSVPCANTNTIFPNTAAIPLTRLFGGFEAVTPTLFQQTQCHNSNSDSESPTPKRMRSNGDLMISRRWHLRPTNSPDHRWKIHCINISRLYRTPQDLQYSSPPPDAYHGPSRNLLHEQILISRLSKPTMIEQYVHGRDQSTVRPS